MQWIAITTMLLDHIGAVWYSDAPVWRLAGRAAFPIYAYYVAVGMARTRNRSAYLKRLAWLAVLSQLPFTLLFNTWTVNVIGTFLLSVAAIYRMEQTANPRFAYLWIAGAAIVMEIVPFDYGAYGLALLLLYRYTQEEQMWIGHLGMNGLLWLASSTPLQMFTIFPTFFFAFKPSESRNTRSVPRWLWRSWYPAHLAILAIISYTTER